MAIDWSPDHTSDPVVFYALRPNVTQYKRCKASPNRDFTSKYLYHPNRFRPGDAIWPRGSWYISGRCGSNFQSLQAITWSNVDIIIKEFWCIQLRSVSKNCSSHRSINWVWKLRFENYCHISQAPMTQIRKLILVPHICVSELDQHCFR